MEERVGALKVSGESAKEMARLLYHPTDEEIKKCMKSREELSKKVSIESTKNGFKAHVEMDIDLNV